MQIENFYGSQAASEIDVYPPDNVKIKGSEKWLISRLEKAMKMNGKPVINVPDVARLGVMIQGIVTI